MVDFMKEIVVSVILQEVLSRAFSFALEKRKEKLSQGIFLERIQAAVNDMEFALERTRKLPITDISLLRRRKEIETACTLGRCLLTKDEQQQKPKNQPVTRSSLRECISGHATKFPFLPLFGFSTERLLSSSDARVFERHADSAGKFVRDVESCCSLWHHTFCCPFVRHLLEGRSLGCEIVKTRSQSISFLLHPVIMEGRGVIVNLCYKYNDSRKLEDCFCLYLDFRISEDTDIIGISVKCMQQLTTQFKLAVKSAIGEVTLLPYLQDTIHSFVFPSILLKDEFVRFIEGVRPDPICCNGNRCGTLANKSSVEIPEPVTWLQFACYISAPRDSLRNAPLNLEGSFEPHSPRFSNEEICIQYGGKLEIRNGSMHQLEEITRSDALDYLVHEPEPTDYALFWFSPHGAAMVTLRQTIPIRRSRRVSKRKR